MTNYIVTISPTIAFEMQANFEDCGKDDPAYGKIFSAGFAGGKYEATEEAVDEYQSWVAYAIGSLLQWMENEPGVYVGTYNSMLAFYKQTVKLIGRRHAIG